MPRRRAALLGSGALVVVAGAIFAAQTLPAHHSTNAAGKAAMTLSGSAGPGQNGISAEPVDPYPRASGSAATTPAGNSASSQYVYSYSTVSAPAAAGPVTTTTSTGPGAVTTFERPLPEPIGNWRLNQTGGNVAPDVSRYGPRHDGIAQNGWWAGGSCLFNGSNSQIYTSGPVLATGAGASFTVSAWVYLDALPAGGGDATAISQDGNSDSGFYLQYAGAAGRWAFSRAASDSGNGGTMYRALSANAPAMTTWTHLVGVYDASSGTLQLYVNGVPQGTATDSTPFASNGAFAFGRGQHNGQDSDWLKGAIKDVDVFDTALDAAQVAGMERND